MSNESLLEHSIPEGRRQLIHSHENLLKVANYCEQNYLSANDKARALDETKAYTTQSLASVAYQVNTLAGEMLTLLSEQEEELARLTSAIDNLGERVDIHCEKVARREVGALTARRPISRGPAVKLPTNPDRPVKYIRKAINYNEFDDLGHGIKMTGQPTMRTIQKNASIRNSVGSSGSTGTIPRAMGQIDQRPGHYGTIGRAIPAPVVPKPGMQVVDGLSSNHSSRIRKDSGNSVGSYDSSKHGRPSSNRSSTADVNSIPPLEMNVPIPSYPESNLTETNYDLPPPPDNLNDAHSQSTASIENDFGNMNIHGMPAPPLDLPAPPADLPAPPNVFQQEIISQIEFTPKPGFISRGPNDPNWAPRQYIQKVIAMYDYDAERADELTFGEGAQIYVVAKNEDGWWEGVLDGRTGLFPNNYVTNA